MGHYIVGFVAAFDALQSTDPLTASCVVAKLRGGYGLMPFPFDIDELDALPASKPAEYGLGLSRGFPIALVKTDYFGGQGDQWACAWKDGAVIVPWSEASVGIINTALCAIGVHPFGGLDAFDTVGLGEFRNNEDWIEFARSGSAMPDLSPSGKGSGS